MTRYNATQCSGCKEAVDINKTVTGFQFPPYYMGPQRLCIECEGKLLAFLIQLHADYRR